MYHLSESQYRLFPTNVAVSCVIFSYIYIFSVQYLSADILPLRIRSYFELTVGTKLL